MQFVPTRHKTRKAIRTAVILVPALMCLMFFGSFLASGQEHKDRLNKKELKELIATAQTPEEHLRVAGHYRAEANDYLTHQKQHEADEKEYNANPQKYPAKYPTPAQHCRDWAYNDGQSARKALTLAEMHETTAKEAAK